MHGFVAHQNPYAIWLDVLTLRKHKGGALSYFDIFDSPIATLRQDIAITRVPILPGQL